MKWSYGIVITFAFFVSFILFLVYRTMTQNIDLVAEDYYAQEIAYQDVIDGKNNFNQLNLPLSVKQTPDSLFLSIPGQGEISGKVLSYRPSDKQLDQEIELTGTSLALSKAGFTPGHYVVKTTWKADTTSYFNEQSLYLQ